MDVVTERVKTSLFLSVTVLCMIQGLSSERWQVQIPESSMCAVSGSSVVISCSFTRPPNVTVEKIVWTFGHLGGSDLLDHSNYRGRVQYSNSVQSLCTLTIRDVKVSDAEEYFLSIITMEEEYPLPKEQVGVTLSVVELSVEISGPVIEGRNVRLSCTTPCDLDGNPAVIWTKNGQEVLGKQASNYDLVLKSISMEDKGDYSCVLKGHGSQPSKPVVLNVMYAPKHTSASVSPSNEIVEGSSVTLTCSSDANPPVEIYTWFKKNIAAAPLVSEQIFTIAVVNSEHTGYYFCEAKNTFGVSNSFAVHLDVQYVPKNTSVSVNSQADEILQGSSVTLTCSSDANPPVEKYSWYKRIGTKVSVLDRKQIYTIAKVGSEHTGYYYCTAMNKYGVSTSTEFHLDVQYAPKQTSASVSPSGELVEGTSVTLTCSSDANPPVQSYTWYKGTGYTGSVLHTEQMYTIDKVSSEHTGSYYCEVKNKHGMSKSPGVNVDVQYAPKNTASVSPSGEIVEGSSVTLTCSSDANPPVQSYSWYKRHGTETSAMATSSIYRISNITPGHAGYYHCRATNKHGMGNSAETHLEVCYAPKYTSVSVSSPDRNREGSSVTLTCNSDANPPVKSYTWYKNGTTPTHIGSGQHHQITDLNSTHSGHYYCEVENTYGFSRSIEVHLEVKLVRWQKIAIVAIIGSATFIVSVLLMCVVYSGVKKCPRRIPAQDTPDHLYEEVTTVPMTSNLTRGQLSGDPDDVQYSTVQFRSFRGQQGPAHSTDQRQNPHAQQQQEEVEYAAVIFSTHTAATRPAQEAVIYSKLLKPRNMKLGKTSV